MFKWIRKLFGRDRFNDNLALELCNNNEKMIEIDLEELINRLCDGDREAAKVLDKLSSDITLQKWDIEMFPTSDHDKTSPQGRLLAFILLCGFCPNCNTVAIQSGPHGGAAINMICGQCGQRYWMMDPDFLDLKASFAIGAYRL